jgi:hypothetical protein
MIYSGPGRFIIRAIVSFMWPGCKARERLTFACVWNNLCVLLHSRKDEILQDEFMNWKSRRQLDERPKKSGTLRPVHPPKSDILAETLHYPMRKKARALTQREMGRLQVCWQSMLQ